MIEISFDPFYHCGVHAPHLVVSTHAELLTIVRYIPEGQRFSVGHMEEGKVTGRGIYFAGKDHIVVQHETGTCCVAG